MAQNQISAKSWLAKNKGDMIVCPFQPGQLTISKTACSKRHLTGKRDDFNDLQKGGDPMNYAYWRGLCLCRDCPIGKKLTVRQRHARA